ncbi:hypothetical protein EJ110_NYTH32094 [Nymphaea thermarum]|nr:hypothetical protein EJ110_NYTH32094 [Nymphaea thermarum]
MWRTAVTSLTRSSTVAAPEPRSRHHGTASAMVHLHFQTRICSETRGAEGGGEEGGSTLAVHVLRLFTSSVIVTRSSLRTREEIMEHVRRHFSDHECRFLLGWADHVAREMCDLIMQPGNGRAALSAGEVQMVSLTTTVTYHLVEFQEDVDGDLEDPTEDMTEAEEEMDLADDLEELVSDDALFAYEAVPAPASKASVDALERKKAEENGQNTCVVCQDEVGRGDCLVRMPCSHEFHEGCILAWLRRAHACPLTVVLHICPSLSLFPSLNFLLAVIGWVPTGFLLLGGRQVLPEVLRHSLQLKTGRPSSLSTLSAYSKWSLPNSSDPSSRRSPDAVNPLRAFISLPPVTFGPTRLGAFLGLTRHAFSLV